MINLHDWLEEDYLQLVDEYKKEIGDEKGRIKYHQLFIEYVPSNIRKKLETNSMDKHYFISEEKRFLDFNWEIASFIDLYNRDFYFLAPFDLCEWMVQLKQDTRFRDFTKLCFYLGNIIGPK